MRFLKVFVQRMKGGGGFKRQFSDGVGRTQVLVEVGGEQVIQKS